MFPPRVWGGSCLIIRVQSSSGFHYSHGPRLLIQGGCSSSDHDIHIPASKGKREEDGCTSTCKDTS